MADTKKPAIKPADEPAAKPVKPKATPPKKISGKVVVTRRGGPIRRKPESKRMEIVEAGEIIEISEGQFSKVWMREWNADDEAAAKAAAKKAKSEDG